MEIILIIGLCWLVCGIVSYGFMFAYLQNEFGEVAASDYHSDMIVSICFGLFGPFSLLAFFAIYGIGHKVKFK